MHKHLIATVVLILSFIFQLLPSILHAGGPGTSGASVNETFTASDMAVALSYARAMKALGRPLNVGLNLKFVSSTIDSKSASAMAADLGAQYKLIGDTHRVSFTAKF
jgi:hypothetical protein